MDFKALGSNGKGELNHGSIGIPETTPEIADTKTPTNAGLGRRSFLRAAFTLGAGAAVAGVGVLGSGRVEARNFTEAEMDKEDDLIVKALGSIEGTDGALDLEKGKKPTEAQIEKYIEIVADRVKLSNKGVHIQQHENAMWLISYFNYMKKTDPRVLYYPSKIGKDSSFVKAMMGKQGVRTETFDRKRIGKEGVTTIYLKPDEKLKFTNKVRALEAVIDTGTAYIIIPEDTPIIETTIKGQRVALLGECRNPIKKVLSECPPTN